MRLELDGVFEAVARESDGRMLWRGEAPNGPTTAGLTDVLSAAFAGGTQRTQWFIGLIDGTSFEELDAGDTLASHGGWSDLTSYTGSRKQWVLTAANALAVSSTPAEFVFTAGCTVKGMFLCTVASGTSGVLYCTALLSAPRAFLAGQSLTLNYRLRAAGGSS